MFLLITTIEYNFVLQLLFLSELLFFVVDPLYRSRLPEKLRRRLHVQSESYDALLQPRSQETASLVMMIHHIHRLYKHIGYLLSFLG